MIKEEIKKCLEEVLAELNLPAMEIKLGSPEDFSHGDYTSSVAMALAKQVGEKPIDLAQKIADKINGQKIIGLDKVTAAPPGFLNFFLKPQYLREQVVQLARSERLLASGLKEIKQKVLVEYTDPNPFKEFHLGHLMSNTIGEATARLFEVAGHEVKRACYQGDVGMHVAKAVWGLQSSKFKVESEKLTIKELGEAYVVGSKAYEENEEAKKEIVAINKKVYEQSDEEINKIYDWGRKLSLDYFETIYQKLGTKFDFYFFESETGKFGTQLVNENLGKVFDKGEGDAIIFPGEKYGLHTRVFLNAEGLPTYEAKELGLAKIKYDRYSYDLSVVITGNEVNEYFRVLLKALSLISPELATRTRHISHGMLRLPTGKMSSRAGNAITAEALIAEVTHLARGNEAVAIGAIKYMILRQAPGREVIFDLAKSVSLEGDSGPYLQYALVRARAVLAKNSKQQISNHNNLNNLNLPNGAPVLLEKLLLHYSETLTRAATALAPQHLVTYLTALAGAWNAFYAQFPIIGSGQDEDYRLALTQAVAKVLHNGLTILAIPIPDKM